MDAQSVVGRVDKLISAGLDGELVLLNVERGKYFGLDTIGRDIWERLESPTRIADLCDTLARDYDADMATILGDVLALLGQMEMEGLISVQSP